MIFLKGFQNQLENLWLVSSNCEVFSVFYIKKGCLADVSIFSDLDITEKRSLYNLPLTAWYARLCCSTNNFPVSGSLTKKSLPLFRCFLDSKLVSGISHVLSHHSGFFDLRAPLYQHVMYNNCAGIAWRIKQSQMLPFRNIAYHFYIHFTKEKKKA